MEFIFDKAKENKAWKYVINDEFFTHSYNTQETKEYAKSFANILSLIENFKTSAISVTISNDTSNEEGKYNDAFYRTYIVNSIKELQALATSIVSQVVDRCEKLLEGDMMLISSHVVNFHRFIGNVAPQAGRIIFNVEVSSPYRVNKYGQKSRRIFRSYEIAINIQEMDTNWDNIFNQ